ESERRALDKAISNDFLVQEGWVVGAYGEIINQSGRTVYDVGYVTAIRKILDE
ncbi:gamma-mobile-trio protein GmtX, partial [Salmonella enterica]